MKIIWSPLALERLRQIVEYIAQDNPSAARRWAAQIFSKVEQLKRFPERGRHVPETHRQNLREILYPPYRLIYRLTSSHVALLTIRHSKQRFSHSDVE